MKYFYFSEAYKMASVIQDEVKEPYTFIEVPWAESEVLQCLIKPSKLSLLHWYIYRTIAVYYRRNYRKNNDSIDENHIDDLQAVFEIYGIEIQPFDEFVSQTELSEPIMGKRLYNWARSDLTPSNQTVITYHSAERSITELDIGEQFYEWFTAKENHFQEFWNHIADEVFQLLFSDRQFLLTFNTSLAEYLKSGAVDIPKDYLDANGRLKRWRKFPEWLKRAVFYRDRGRCVFCHTDLSGLLTTDFKKHLDHIVPLFLWGTNDASNIQLTCETCNLRKLDDQGMTSPRYTPWWED
jgi:hypothetical protein